MRIAPVLATSHDKPQNKPLQNRADDRSYSRAAMNHRSTPNAPANRPIWEVEDRPHSEAAALNER